MAKGLQQGNAVIVAASRIGQENSSPSALVQRDVISINGRRAELRETPGGVATRFVATSKLHRNFGILVLEIGDLATEDLLLDPLARSLVDYLRILLPTDDFLKSLRVRTLAEITAYWALNHGLFTHVVLIGHGSSNSIRFVDQDPHVTPARLVQAFHTAGVTPKEFISLACQTGRAAFARGISAAGVCSQFVGPFQSVHGIIASQFCQSYLGYILLEGRSPAVAFRRASASVPDGTHFRLWRDGVMTAGA